MHFIIYFLIIILPKIKFVYVYYDTNYNILSTETPAGGSLVPPFHYHSGHPCIRTQINTEKTKNMFYLKIYRNKPMTEWW